MDDDNKKTRKLDENYFKSLAERAKSIQTDNDKTQILGNSPPIMGGEAPIDQGDENRTRIFNNTSDETPSDNRTSDTVDPMADPPSGWLVAVDGPGKGHVLTIGIGMNGIGRGNVRVPILFKDDFISRGKSAAIAFDSVNRQFYLLPGDGKTLAYLNSKPVVESQEIKTGATFTLGKTTFRFIALCDSTFNWE